MLVVAVAYRACRVLVKVDMERPCSTEGIEYSVCTEAIPFAALTPKSGTFVPNDKRIRLPRPHYASYFRWLRFFAALICLRVFRVNIFLF